MKISDIWNLTRESFIIQIEGTEEDADKLADELAITFPDKLFYIHVKE